MTDCESLLQLACSDGGLGGSLERSSHIGVQAVHFRNGWRKVDGLEFLHQLLVRSHLSVLGTGLCLIVESDHLWDGADVDVVADVAEEGGGDSPEDSVLALGNILLGLLIGSLGGFGVDDLMVAGQDVSSGDVLEHSSSL